MIKNFTNKIKKFKSFTTKEIVNLAKEKAINIEKEVFDDYSYESETFDQFIHTTQKESERSRVQTYRFISSIEGLDLIQEQLSSFRKLFTKNNFYISPMLYLRICRPGILLSKKHHKSLLFTEPHYDKSNKFEFYSIWIPLSPSTKKTGTLCEFDKNLLKIEFPLSGKNKFSLTRYLDNHKEIDPLIRKSVIPVFCESSSYLYWDSTTLHGATKPTHYDRISLNYQVFSIEKDYYEPNNTESIAIKLFSEFPVLFCFSMLSTVNDNRGMIKLYSDDRFKNEIKKCFSLKSEFYKKFLRFIDLNLANINNNTKIPTREKVHWTQDYKWIRDIYCVK